MSNNFSEHLDKIFSNSKAKLIKEINEFLPKIDEFNKFLKKNENQIKYEKKEDSTEKDSKNFDLEQGKQEITKICEKISLIQDIEIDSVEKIKNLLNKLEVEIIYSIYGKLNNFVINIDNKERNIFLKNVEIFENSIDNFDNLLLTQEFLLKKYNFFSVLNNQIQKIDSECERKNSEKIFDLIYELKNENLNDDKKKQIKEMINMLSDKKNIFNANKKNYLEKLLYAFKNKNNNQNSTLENLNQYIFEKESDLNSQIFKIKELIEIYNSDKIIKEHEKKYLQNFENNKEKKITNEIEKKILKSMANLQSNKGNGSAVLYKLDEKNGYAYYITNEHVVCDAKNFFLEILDPDLTKEDSKFFSTIEVVGFSENEDIAILKVYVQKEKATKMKNTQIVKEFSNIQNVISAGNSKGEFFGKARCKEKNTTNITFGNILYASKNEIIHNAEIYEGNSGGGLFDENGNLIGINYASNLANQIQRNSTVSIEICTKIADQFILEDQKKQKIENSDIKKKSNEKAKNRHLKGLKACATLCICSFLFGGLCLLTLNKLLDKNFLQNSEEKKNVIKIISTYLLFFAACLFCISFVMSAKDLGGFFLDKIEEYKLNKKEQEPNV